jgi:alpha-aminoadipic semialdehyde synthase
MNRLLIRAEDKNQWERRTPLIPSDLQELVRSLGVEAHVEASAKRCFDGVTFEASGATICEDMHPGDVILGVKEIPTHKILDSKVYLFFSHTVKGQPYNMPMLKRILQSRSTLIDFERIVDESGRRLVYFGPFAGQAGALDILWLMGENWRSRRISTPFLRCRQAMRYPSLESALQETRVVGEEIKTSGLPTELSPLIIGVLGYGQVSQGAQKVFECLPLSRVNPADLHTISSDSRNTIFLSVFQEKDLVERKDGSDFDLQDYYERPDHYRSRFSYYLNRLSIVVNAIYWDARYPRFITWNCLREQQLSRLAGIADITCDPNGSIECNVGATDSGNPAYLVDPVAGTIQTGHLGDGIVLLAVDNLPAELPVEASTFFSGKLKTYLPEILRADFSRPLPETSLSPEVQGAVITHRGQLAPPYQYLSRFLDN